ncbi:thioesterase II family protein [Planobispora takensis]|uniref:Thioesterase n=1 Tax=Planobispora takensis TaxID=1367882 RepID=A0A8J3WXJ2_9ACTN|nr:alpha/beta fold hydrolase [Planobispora takensis]GII02917.1 thioesterase [Planobispora takensis]
MTPWFVQIKEGERALVTFPHAGGGPSSLNELAAHFPPEVGLWAVNLPGRQARLAEPPRTDLDGLVDDLARDLAAWREPYTLFGYCSGALLAYLVCRRVVELGGAPERLVVASFAAPDITPLLRRLPALPSWLFWEQLLDLGGVPPELAEREALWPVLEPALRADFGLLAGYRHRAAPPLPVPVTVLYGTRDRSLSRGGLLGWRRHSAHRPALRPLDSTHWLAEETPGPLAAAIAQEMGCASVTA